MGKSGLTLCLNIFLVKPHVEEELKSRTEKSGGEKNPSPRERDDTGKRPLHSIRQQHLINAGRNQVVERKTDISLTRP